MECFRRNVTERIGERRKLIHVHPTGAFYCLWLCTQEMNTRKITKNDNRLYVEVFADTMLK